MRVGHLIVFMCNGVCFMNYVALHVLPGGADHVRPVCAGRALIGCLGQSGFFPCWPVMLAGSGSDRASIGVVKEIGLGTLLRLVKSNGEWQVSLSEDVDNIYNLKLQGIGP